MPRPPILIVPARRVRAAGQPPRPAQPPRSERGRALPARRDGATAVTAAAGTGHATADQLRVVQEVCDWLEDAIGSAAQGRDTSALLQHARDRALLLMLFWRRVSAAELLAARVEKVRLAALTGASCNIASAQGERRISWRPITHPALKPLCPVAALRLWLSVSGLRCGPLFPRIKHGGDLADECLPPDSVLPLLFGLVALSHGEDACAAS